MCGAGTGTSLYNGPTTQTRDTTHKLITTKTTLSTAGDEAHTRADETAGEGKACDGSEVTTLWVPELGEW